MPHLEDRYETRLRAVIEAKPKGEGIESGAAAEPKAEAETAPATTPPEKQKRAAGQVSKAPRKRA